ncbi:MAG TPA: FAD-binding protein, partial [Thermodesulfatator atlanticus]|nr:FAD-binding protein [Thermodesulfatator atlanticus]
MSTSLSARARQKLRKLLKGRFLEARKDLLAYAFDASGLTYLPEAVAVPANAAEVAAILKLANEENFPVIPRGAGTATTGAPLAVAGGLVLSLLGLNRILEINPDDLVAVVEPGVFNGTFKRELAERGLFYPPDPASYEFSTLGGNVATCAGGPKGLKYGVTKDYVLGLEVVLPTGEIVFCGRRTMKGVVGYDLVSLIVGSEGTLGVITKMVLKLLPKPPATASLAVYFERITQAAEGFLALVKGGLLPAAAELLDAVTLQAVARFFPKDWPEKTRALL